MGQGREVVGFADEFEEFDDQFESDKEAGTLPDGTYGMARVTEARMEHDEETDQWTMVWKFESEYADANNNLVQGSIRKWWNDIGNPDNAQGRQFLAKDMKRVGYEGKLSGLQDACESEQFIGLEVEIAVKTKPGRERDYTNVYINRLSPGAVSAGGPEFVPTGAGSSAADDDIPF
jgi:hypothetical protein